MRSESFVGRWLQVVLQLIHHRSIDNQATAVLRFLLQPNQRGLWRRSGASDWLIVPEGFVWALGHGAYRVKEPKKCKESGPETSQVSAGGYCSFSAFAWRLVLPHRQRT